MTGYVRPTAKGQITLRKSVLRHMDLRPGQRLEIRPTADGNVLIVPEKPKHGISAIFGMFAGYKGGDVQTHLDPSERDRQAIMDHVASEDDRSRS